MENKQQMSRILFSIGKVLYDNKKYLEAYRYLESAANDGNTDAMVLCGKLVYKHGENGFVDIEKATDFYKKAADLGSIRGMFKFGEMIRYFKFDRNKA